jgi:Rrf2 family transcriptional regulator, nitric oxide-sensitive transcriptional repressor
VISQTAEYALRAVTVLASQADCPLTAQQIAARTRVPPSYLSKILQALGRAGLVQAQRGLGGGYVMSRPLQETSVLDVINAVDPLKRIDHCPLGALGHGRRLCSLHRQLDQGIALVQSHFGQTTIAQLVADQRPSRPLCEAAVDSNDPDRS